MPGSSKKILLFHPPREIYDDEFYTDKGFEKYQRNVIKMLIEYKNSNVNNPDQNLFQVRVRLVNKYLLKLQNSELIKMTVCDMLSEMKEENSYITIMAKQEKDMTDLDILLAKKIEELKAMPQIKSSR